MSKSIDISSDYLKNNSIADSVHDLVNLFLANKTDDFNTIKDEWRKSLVGKFDNQTLLKIEIIANKKIEKIVIEKVKNTIYLSHLIDFLGLDFSKSINDRYGLIFELYKFDQYLVSHSLKHKIKDLNKLILNYNFKQIDLIANYFILSNNSSFKIGSKDIKDDEADFLKEQINHFYDKKTKTYRNDADFIRSISYSYPGVIFTCLIHFVENGFHLKIKKKEKKHKKNKIFNYIFRSLLIGLIGVSSAGFKISRDTLDAVKDYSNVVLDPLDEDIISDDLLDNQNLSSNDSEIDNLTESIKLVNNNQELSLYLESFINSLPEDHNLALSLLPIKKDNHNIEALNINEKIEFNAFSVSKLFTAGNILRQVSLGNIRLDDKVQYGEVNLDETVEELLIKLIVNSDNQAQRYLTSYFLYKTEKNESRKDYLENILTEEYGLSESKFIGDNSLSFQTNSEQISLLLNHLLTSNYLNQQQKIYLLDLMHQSTINKFTITNANIGMHENILVSEKIGLGSMDQNNNMEMHSANYIKTNDGEYILVIMSKGKPYILQPVIDKITSAIVYNIDNNLADSKYEGIKQYAFSLNNNLQSKEQFISMLLKPLDLESGKQHLNPYLRNIENIEEMLLNSEKLLFVSPDGTKVITLINDKRQIVINVGVNQEIISVIDSLDFQKNNLDLFIVTETENNQPFLSDKFLTTDNPKIIINDIITPVDDFSIENQEKFVRNLMTDRKTNGSQLFVFVDDHNSARIFYYISPNKSSALSSDLHINLVSNSHKKNDSNVSKVIEILLNEFIVNNIYGQLNYKIIHNFSNVDYSIKEISNYDKTNIEVNNTNFTGEITFKIKGNLLQLYKNQSITSSDLLENDVRVIDSFYINYHNYISLLKQSNESISVNLSRDQFIETIIELLNTSELNKQDSTISIPLSELNHLFGVGQYQNIIGGVMYNGYVYVPAKVDPLSLTENFLSGKNILKTNTPYHYLVGEPVIDSIISNYGYKYHQDSLIYQYLNENNELILSSSPPDDISSIESIYPLNKPLDALATNFQTRIKSTDKKINVNIQFIGDEQYTIFDVYGESNLPLYFDSQTLDLYVADSEKNFYPVIGYNLSYQEIADFLFNNEISNESLVEKILEERLLTLVSEQTKKDDLFWISEGQNLINKYSNDNNLPSRLSLYRDDSNKNNFVLDQDYKLLYVDEFGDKWTFDNDKYEFVPNKELSQNDNIELVLKDFKILTDNNNIPLHYKGLPVLSKDNLLYIFSSSGLELVSTIFSLGELDLSSDPALNIFYRKIGLSNYEQIREKIYYSNLRDNDEKIIHSIAIENSNFLETDGFLIDKENKKYLLAHSGEDRLLSKNNFNAVLLEDGTDKLYQINNFGELVEIKIEDTITENEFFELEKYSLELDSNKKQYFDRFTRLPVLSDGSHIYILSGSGLKKIGNFENLLKLGLIGYIDDVTNEFKVSSELNSYSETFFGLADQVLENGLEVSSKYIDKTLYPNENSTSIVDFDYVYFDSIPRNLVLAVISSEDQNHFKVSDGETYSISSEALLRTILQKFQSGGSTIAQQTLRNATLPPANRTDRLLERKIYDWIGAHQLNQNLNTEKVLELYLNIINYRQTGVNAGAEYIFEKSIRELTLGETALLTIIPKYPSAMHAFSYKNADLWADTASGVIRRMYEQGFIDLEEMKETWLEIYSLLEIDSQKDDIEFLRSYMTENKINVEEADFNQAIQEYSDLNFNQRLLIENADGSKSYGDFVYYLSSGDRNYFNDQQVIEIREKYYELQLWKLKIDNKYTPMNNNFSKDYFIGYSRPNSFNYNDDNYELNPYSLVANYSSESIKLNKLGMNGNFPLFISNSQVFQLNNKGLIEYPLKLSSISDSGKLIQIGSELLIEGSLNLPSGVTNPGNLFVSSEGLYFTEAEDGLNFFGRKVYVANEDSQYIVPMGNMSELITSNEFSNLAFVSLYNILDVNLQKEIKVKDLIRSSLSNLENPNFSFTYFDDKNSGLINPTALQISLSNLDIESSVLEFDSFLDDNGRDFFIETMKDLSDQKQPFLVWIKVKGFGKVNNFGSDSHPFYEQVSDLEYPVSVLSLFDVNNKTYVSYVDPTIPGIQTIELNNFSRLASPVKNSRYKMLVLGSYNYDEEEYAKLKFDPFSVSRQFEMSAFYEDFDINNNPFKESTSIDYSLQKHSENIINSNFDGKPIRFLFTDEYGQIISVGGLDSNGNKLTLKQTLDYPIPAGSVFKPLTAIYGLDNGLNAEKKSVAGDFLFVDEQGYILNHTAMVNSSGMIQPTSIANGQMNLVEALATSNNVYFANLSTIISNSGPLSFISYAKDKLGISQPGRIPGFSYDGGNLPYSQFNGIDSNYAEFLSMYTYFGQYGVNTTLFELLRVYTAFPNNKGIMYNPTILANNNNVFKTIGITTQEISSINSGLHDAAFKSYGTVYGMFNGDEPYDVYVKTGTAEHGDYSQPHAHFFGWAKSKTDPSKIVVFGLSVENGGSGALVAAPMTKEILDFYFENKSIELKKISKIEKYYISLKNIIESILDDETTETNKFLLIEQLQNILVVNNKLDNTRIIQNKDVSMINYKDIQITNDTYSGYIMNDHNVLDQKFGDRMNNVLKWNFTFEDDHSIFSQAFKKEFAREIVRTFVEDDTVLSELEIQKILEEVNILYGESINDYLELRGKSWGTTPMSLTAEGKPFFESIAFRDDLLENGSIDSDLILEELLQMYQYNEFVKFYEDLFAKNDNNHGLHDRNGKLYELSSFGLDLLHYELVDGNVRAFFELIQQKYKKDNQVYGNAYVYIFKVNGELVEIEDVDKAFNFFVETIIEQIDIKPYDQKYSVNDFLKAEDFTEINSRFASKTKYSIFEIVGLRRIGQDTPIVLPSYDGK